MQGPGQYSDEYDDRCIGDGSIDDPHRKTCHYCDGDGWGLVGVDWDSDDPINGPYDGQSQRCPCCHGSGKAEDETFW
jgi:DnaJ-class molecular chaperone